MWSRFFNGAFALLLIVLVGGISLPAVGQTYNLNASFLDNEKPDGSEINPFGQFTYGYSLTPSNTAAFVAFNGPTQHTQSFGGVAGVEGWLIPNDLIVPAVVQNVTASTITPGYAPSGILAGELMLHPGNPGPNAASSPVADAIVRFTAVVTGEYDIVGNFRSQNNGTVNARVLRNGVVLQTVGDAGPISILDLNLIAGDVIDFAVNDAGSISADSTGLSVVITATAVPEPATVAIWASCAIAAITFGWRFRRRS